MKRPIRKILLGDVAPNAITSAAPEVRIVDPATLLVDEDYQRALSERSMRLIRRIVSGWDWARFKSPVVAETEDGLEVIDGQHTAIAAASHPEVARIPVLVVQAQTKAARANAFVGHNRDRLQITQTQMHFSAAAAGDEDALIVNQVCERAGVRLLKNPPPAGNYKPGDSMAVLAVSRLISRRSPMRARIVLQTLVNAQLAPVTSDAIKAVDRLLYDEEYAGTVEPDDLSATWLRIGGGEAEKEARLFAAAHKTQHWKALAVVLYRSTRKRRRASA